MKRVATALALLAFLVVVPASQAAYDPLAGGSTRLILDKEFAAFLKRDGVELGAVAPAKRKGGSLVLPVSGGSVDPTTVKGSIDNEGSLVFQGGRKRVPLRGITVKTKHSPLIAKVGGGQLKIATSAKLSSKREGFGSSFTAKALKLTAKVATRLNKKLRPRVPFGEGQVLGTLVSKSRPQLMTVLGADRATVVFDPAFLAKLGSLFVSVNPIFPAEHSGPTFTFPIAVGSTIAPDGSAGTLRSGGAVELLQLGAGQVFWHELWLDPGARSDSAEVDVEPTPAFSGKLGRIGIFDLGLASAAADPAARTVSVAGALALQAQAAKTLNEAFAAGKEAFRTGEAVGALSFTAQAQ